MVLGALFWMLTVVFPLTALHFRLFAWLDHSEKLSLAVVAGGASLAGGIIFLLAPRRRRPWRSDERRDPFANAGSLVSPSTYDGLDFAGTLRPPPSNTTRSAEGGAIARGLEHYPLPGALAQALARRSCTEFEVPAQCAVPRQK
jgi:hypothetical protein